MKGMWFCERCYCSVYHLCIAVLCLCFTWSSWLSFTLVQFSVIICQLVVVSLIFVEDTLNTTELLWLCVCMSDGGLGKGKSTCVCHEGSSMKSSPWHWLQMTQLPYLREKSAWYLFFKRVNGSRCQCGTLWRFKKSLARNLCMICWLTSVGPMAVWNQIQSWVLQYLFWLSIAL